MYNLWITPNIPTFPTRHLVKSDEIATVNTWRSGNSSYLWLNDSQILLTTIRNGFSCLEKVNIENSNSDDPLKANKVTLKLNDGASTLSWDGVYMSLSCHNDHCVFFYEDYQTRGLIVLLNTSSMKIKILLQSGVRYSPHIRCKFTKPFHESYLTEDGTTTVHGIIYMNDHVKKEKEKQKFPLLVILHGGPNGFCANRFGFHSEWGQYFSSRNFIVLMPNYRGSFYYGRQYRLALNNKWGIHDVDDTTSGARHIIDKYNADPERCAVMGASAGGYTTLLAMCNSDKFMFAAGVDICGVTDLFNLDKHTHLLERHYNLHLIGPLPASIASYIARSPVNLAHKIKQPLAILHGAKDTVVPKEQSLSIKKIVESSGIVVEYFDFPNVAHMLVTGDKFYENIEEFLVKYVLQKSLSKL